jgi:hypothetical protein
MKILNYLGFIVPLLVYEEREKREKRWIKTTWLHIEPGLT